MQSFSFGSAAIAVPETSTRVRPGENVTDLATQLNERAADLASRVNDTLYRDPFWEARFGARGREFAQSDGVENIAYLARSVRYGSSAFLENHLLWLRTVLSTRGMCTMHIQVAFAVLRELLLDSGMEGIEQALDHLDAAVAALAYADGPPARIQKDAETLATSVAGNLLTQHPAFGDQLPAPVQDTVRRDTLYILSYLSDSLALGRPDILRDHVSWLSSNVRVLGRPDGYIEELVRTLRLQIEDHRPTYGETAGETLDLTQSASSPRARPSFALASDAPNLYPDS